MDDELVADDWNAGPNKGIVTHVGRGHRRAQGQPQGHQGLGRPGQAGRQHRHPQPRLVRLGDAGTSSRRTATCSPTAAPRTTPKAYLTKFFDNVVALPGSGRDATTAFLGGTGDVLLSYENEAILARQDGADFDYVVPDQTLLIENPGAVPTDADPTAKDFLDFVLSDAGPDRRTPSRASARSTTSVEASTSRAPTTRATRSRRPTTLLTIDDDFGGWADGERRSSSTRTTGIVTQACWRSPARP